MKRIGFILSLVKFEMLCQNYTTFTDNFEIFKGCLELIAKYLLDVYHEIYFQEQIIPTEKQKSNNKFIDIIDELIDFEVVIEFFQKNSSKKVFRDLLFQTQTIKAFYVSLIR